MYSIENNLFYSKKENLLFWIAGYMQDTGKTWDIIKGFDDAAQSFMKFCKVPYNTIYQQKIHDRRYKNMYVFYCEASDYIPDIAYRITKADWTFSKWIHD